MAKNEATALEAVKKYINELDLSMITKKMIDTQGWLKSEVDEASILYKNFLYLNYKYPNEILAPSEDIDELWHNHILDTKKYKIDCENIFGRYLDHYPYLGIDGITTTEDADNAFAKMQKLHRNEFGYSVVSVRYTKLCRFFRRFLDSK